MRRLLSRSVLGAIFSAQLSLIDASAVISNPTPDCSAGATCTVTFSTTNDYFQWTVPSGITSLTVDLSGAQGGSGASNGQGLGGKGGRVQATLSASPGAVLRIYVGGAGSFNSTGGYNGGGTASGNSHGGSGGGGSDIRTSPYALADRVIVGGGGGGGSGGSHVGPGGNGGGLIGQSIGNTCGSNFIGGGGGTQSAGGSGGSNYGTSQAGSFGLGGGVASYHNPGGGGGWYGGGSGSVCGGGGGSSYSHPTFATSVTHTQGYKSGGGEVKLTYLNAPSVTSFTSITASPTNTSSDITYSLSFSQNLNSVANSDFSNAGTASGCIFSVSASTGSNFTLTVSGCSEGTLIPQVLANSVFGTVTNSNGPSADSPTSNPITIDRTAPTISSVTAPANKTYIPSETPTFTVAFSESITVTGTPRLTLTVGSATEYANYLSMVDSRTARFRYTVASDPLEFDTDGIAISTTLDLNSGTIRDLATNSISNLSFTAPTLTSVLVAQPAAAPTIDSITATSGQLAIYFTPGAARGSTTSTYQYSSNGGAFTNRPTGNTASPIILTGLTNGTGYTIRLRATTNAGAGDSSTAVTETPTAISVTGDSTLSLTYGNSASTSAYSATGGTNTFTWSLGSSLTGVSLSGTTVTASSSTPAGTYTQTVRATDGNSQVGSKTLTITVAKASTSISIALPNASTTAAAGGAVTITATVSRAGSVNFKIGGVTISGCGAAAAASTTATCLWTAPGSLGAVTLSADFTPTDSANYETSTTGSLSITVVDGVSTVTLSLTGGTTTPPKGQTINIIAAVDQAGRITFLIDGKRIPGCNNKVATVGNVTCSWKPAIQKQSTITARLVPTNNIYTPSTSSLSVRVIKRTGNR